MLRGLKILFGCILVVMFGVTIWASLDKNVVDGTVAVFREPWGAATFADAYCGFLTFYAWVFYKETGWFSRIAWLVAILILGNIAMAFYVLRKISKLAPGSGAEKLLLREAA